MNKKGEWLLVHGENFDSLQPEFVCSICHNMIAGDYPPNVCEHCGSVNEFKGHSISVRIGEEQ